MTSKVYGDKYVQFNTIHANYREFKEHQKTIKVLKGQKTKVL